MAVIQQGRVAMAYTHNYQTWIEKQRTIKRLPLILGVVALLLTLITPSGWLSNLLISPAAASAQTSKLWPSFRHGVMYTRNFVRGEKGERIFAEFGDDGNVLQEYGEAVDHLQGATTLSGDAYRLYVSAYNQLITNKGTTDAKGATILSRAAYEATTFTTIDGQAVNRPSLSNATKSVVVRHQNTILTPATNPLLLQSGIDLQSRQTLSTSTTTVLLNKTGQILHTSENNIGYRVAYIKPKGGEPGTCTSSYGPEEDNRWYRTPEDDACGPIRDALITTSVFPGREGGTYTDPAGKYSLTYMNLPCPGFDFEYTNYFIPTLYYSNFNPRSANGIGMYYQLYPVYDRCFGSHELLKGSGSLVGLMTYLSVESILATNAKPSKRLDINIDILALTGKGYLSNSADAADTVALGPTGYKTDLPEFTPAPPEALDLDGDRIPDAVEATQKDYNNDGIIDGYGIYLNGKQPGDLDAEGNPILPDLIRKADTVPDINDQGLLSTLSEEDLQQTDLLVYRVSNDQLIFQRKGLNPQKDGYIPGQGGGTQDDGNASFYYSSLIRGPNAAGSAFFNESFNTWQAKVHMNPALYQRAADHLKIGETIKLIAINRKTGYIGTATTQVGNAAASSTGSLDFPIPDIIMRPPNLKIRAERQYTVETGITQGKEREYLIGFEGSGLTSDETITLRTEWFDHDGSPLPADLPGYTGRLAKIVANQTLGDNIAEFDIKPGVRLEWMRLPEDAALANDHYYVHVNGQPLEDSPDFSAIGAGPGILQSRPKHYVPFKVAILDEIETRKRRNQQRYLKEDGLLAKDEPKADAVYAWPYRPEMQFSVLELDLQAINRTDAQDNVINILPAGQDSDPNTIPGFASGDQLVELAYDLTMNPNAPLEAFGYSDPTITQADPENSLGREFIFALGEDEVRATFGADQIVKFENLDHLGALDAEDYLSIRMYQNTDAENILYEFAFEVFVLESQTVGSDNWVGDSYIVTADEPEVALIGHLVGYGLRDKQYQLPRTVLWQVNGDGALEKNGETNETGVFLNTLHMPRTAGSTAIVKGSISDSPEVTAYFSEVEVIPGKPAVITIEQSGKASISQVGQTDILIKAWDAWGNPVIDGVALEVSIQGDARVYPDVAFENGQAEAVVQGGLEPDITTLRVKVGEVVQTQQVEIHDLNINLLAGAQLQAGQLSTVSINITDVDGNPVPNLVVELASTKGKLQSNTLTTGAGGSALTYLHPGEYSGQGRLSALVNLSRTDHLFEILPDASEAIFSAKQAVVMGSYSSDGDITATRYDGSNVLLGYRASSNVTLTGSVGEVIELTLGTQYEPAIEPVRLYELSRLEGGQARELVSQQNGTVLGVTQTNTHPNRIGSSLAFDGVGQINLPTNTDINLSQQVGLNIAFNPNAHGGTLISHQGGQALELQSNGTLRYTLNTSTGTYSIDSAPTELNQWHRVAARYHQGQIELEVDGVTTTGVASGDVAYAGSNLTLGEGYQGNLSGLRFYDWNAPKLLTLPNGQQSMTVTIGSTGSEAITVQSTGQMGQHHTSQLPGLAVAINAKGINRHISLLSEGGFHSLGVQYLETAHYGTQPALVAGTGEQLLNVVIPTAQAGLFNDIWDGLASVVEFIIPLGAIEELATQLKYFATSDARFDASKLIFSSLEVITIFPLAKPLLPLIKAGGKFGGPLIKIFNRFKHYNTLKYLADYVGQAGKAVINNRNFDKFVVLLPFFITVGEMYVENPESIEIMLKSMGSAADVEAWIKFLFLPAEEEAATVAYNYMGDPWNTGQSQYASLIDYVIPLAQAANLSILKTVAGTAFARVLIKVAEKGQDILLEDPKMLSKVFAEAYQAVRKIGNEPLSEHIKDVRKYLHDTNAITAMASVGARASSAQVRAFLSSANRRIGFVETVALVSYLESRRSHFDSIDPEISRQLNLLIGSAFFNVLLEGDIGNGKKVRTRQHNCPTPDKKLDEDNDMNMSAGAWALAWNKAAGALYHLSQVAILDAQSITNGYSIKAIEQPNPVKIIEKEGATERSYNRVVDIVLESPNQVDEDDKWVEVKSYQRDYKNTNYAYRYAINPPHPLQKKWNAFKRKKSTIPRRQFFLDRVHARKDAGFENRMEWRFHDFEIKGKGSCAGKNVVGLKPADVTWIRKGVFEPIPKIVNNSTILTKTFNFETMPAWNIFNKVSFKAKLNSMVVSAGHTDLLSGVQFEDFAPLLGELASHPVD